MIILDDSAILMIEPKSKKSEMPVIDELTVKMKDVLRRAKKGRRFKGVHRCICGKMSGSQELFVGGKLTNSLAVHYLKWHRDDVPESELEKVRNLR